MPRYDVPRGALRRMGHAVVEEISRHMLTTAAKYHLTLDFTLTPIGHSPCPTSQMPPIPVREHRWRPTASMWTVSHGKRHFDGPVPLFAAGFGRRGERACSSPALRPSPAQNIWTRRLHTLSYESRPRAGIGERSSSRTESSALLAGFLPTGGRWGICSVCLVGASFRRKNLPESAAGSLFPPRRPGAHRLLGRRADPSYGAEFMHTAAMFIESLEYPTHLDWTLDFGGFSTSKRL